MGNAWSPTRRQIKRPQVCQPCVEPPVITYLWPPFWGINSIEGTITTTEGVDYTFTLGFYMGWQPPINTWFGFTGINGDMLQVELNCTSGGFALDCIINLTTEFDGWWDGEGTKLAMANLRPMDTGTFTIDPLEGSGSLEFSLVWFQDLEFPHPE